MSKEEKCSAVGVSIETSKNSKCQSKILFNINKEMLPYKIHFFLFIGGMGCVSPFISALGRDVGITATSFGAVITVHMFSCILTKPLFGYLADYFNKLKAIIFILTVVQVTFLFLLLAIPKIDLHGQSINNKTHLQSLQPKFSLCKMCSEVKESEWTYEKELNGKIFFQPPSCSEITNQLSTIYCQQQEKNIPVLSNAILKLMVCNINALNATLNNESISNEYKHSLLPVTMLHNVTIPEAVVLCEKRKFSYELSKINLTAEHLLISCLSQATMSGSLSGDSNGNDLHMQNIHCDEKEAVSNLAINDNFILSIYKTYQYWLFGIFYLLATNCTDALVTLWDTACHETLQRTRSEYGKQRVWASVSLGVVTILAGFLDDITHEYLAAWCVMGAVMALDLWNLSRMDMVKPHFSPNFLKDIGKVLGSVEFLAFELGVFLNGFSAGIIQFYLTWFLVGLDANRLLIGLAHAVQCILGDTPLFFYSAWLIKKVGYFNVVTLGLLAHALRFFIYSYIYNPWLILPVETLHGFTHGLFHSAITTYAKENAKPGTEATTQSLLCSTYKGVGVGLSCVLVGSSFDRFGGHKTFFYFGIFAACAAGINITSTLILRARKRKMQITNETDSQSICSAGKISPAESKELC